MKPPTVFFSYAHENEDHKQRVRALCDLLRSNGVDASIDQYEQAPAEGWPAWMSGQVSRSDFVVIVCSESYHRRASGNETPGRGLGAVWESQMVTAELYRSGGKNTKFIPVFFASDDKRFIPAFVETTTYYDLGADGGYETLYRRLTNQPTVSKPALGNLLVLPPKDGTPSTTSVPKHETSDIRPSPEQLVVMYRPDGSPQVFELDEATVSDDLRLVVKADSGSQIAFLESLQGKRHEPIPLAFGMTAYLGRLKSLAREVRGGKDTWTVLLERMSLDDAIHREAGFAEISADAIAEMRARLVLLNESPPPRSDRPGEAGKADDLLLRALVQGATGFWTISNSPFPTLFKSYATEVPTFLNAARLFAILWLRMSATVEHMSELELSMAGPSSLSVRCRGTRPRKYVNVDPLEIVVQGTCDLAEESPRPAE